MNLPFLNLTLVFLCGLLYEVTSTYWLFASEGLKPVRAGLWSLLQAVVMLTGIAESIQDFKSAVSFVIGYALGSVIGVAIEKHRRKEICTTKTEMKPERATL